MPLCKCSFVTFSLFGALLFLVQLMSIHRSQDLLSSKMVVDDTKFVLAVINHNKSSTRQPNFPSNYHHLPNRASKLANNTITMHHPFQSSMLRSRVTTSSGGTHKQQWRGLDFYLIGWPKTGSSALAQVLQYHPQVVMPMGESTEWWNNEPDPLGALDRELEALENRKLLFQKRTGEARKLQRGIKFPGEYKEWQGLQLLQQHQEAGNNATKIIVGIRHPALLFQSFYNYRVQEWHSPGSWFYHKEGNIPSPNSLMEDRNWGDGVNVNLLRFDQYLKSFEKTRNNVTEVWKGWGENLTPSRHLRNPVFLYHMDQLGDKDEARLEQFRTRLQTFLNLSTPLQPLRKTNSLRRTYNETMNICDAQHDQLRRKLVQEVGRESYKWINTYFLKNEQVVLANPNHFKSLLELFRNDPCEAKQVQRSE